MKTRQTADRAIDGVDCAIIQLLQKDGRITNIEIARKLKVSAATVRARMKRRIDEKINQILGYRPGLTGEWPAVPARAILVRGWTFLSGIVLWQSAANQAWRGLIDAFSGLKQA